MKTPNLSLVQYFIPWNISGLLGFWTLSIVWYSKEHNVPKTGSVSVQ
jgi:hypothetical protein